MKNVKTKSKWKKYSLYSVMLLVVLLMGMCFFAAGEDYLAVSLDYLLDVFKPAVISEMSFKVVDIPEGDRFYAGEGCEFILRGGTATVRASELGGINDSTEGTDLWGGLTVPANHLLIVPRDDGRGFVAETDVIIMVKGKHFIGK